MKFLKKIYNYTSSYINLILMLLISALTIILDPISSLVACIQSILHCIFEKNTNKNVNSIEKSKFYKNFKKASIFICITLNITNLSINYDYYTQPIYKKFSLQKNPFTKNNYGNEKNINTNNKNINEICANVLMSAIETNPYLKEKEKNYLIPIKQFFLDNQYLDYEKTYHSLNSFYIHDDLVTKLKGWYIYNRKSPKNVTTSAQTTYNSLAQNQKNINIYNFDFNESDYIHELFHIIGEFDNNFFNEGIVSLLTKEYFFLGENSNDCYIVQRLVTQIIIEIIGADNMLKAFSNSNFDLVKEKLNEINNNSELTDQFLTYVNENKIFYSKEDIITILNYINSYKEKLDYETQDNITECEENLYLGNDLTNSFYYNSKLKNRQTNPIVNNKKVLKKQIRTDVNNIN